MSKDGRPSAMPISFAFDRDISDADAAAELAAGGFANLAKHVP
jgi:hypothetical protein